MIKSRIFKLEKSSKGEFVKIPNDLFGSVLSLQAMGLLCYLLHLPGSFTVRKTKLYEKFKNGRDSVLTAFNELVAAGHIIQHKEQLERGIFSYWYEISPTVTVNPSTAQPLTRKFSKADARKYTKEILEEELKPYVSKYGPEMIRQFSRFYCTADASHILRINRTKRWVLKDRLHKFSKTSTAYEKYNRTVTKAIIAPKNYMTPIKELYGTKK